MPENKFGPFFPGTRVLCLAASPLGGGARILLSEAAGKYNNYEHGKGGPCNRCGDPKMPCLALRQAMRQ